MMPLLNELHFLPFEYRILYKISLLVFKGAGGLFGKNAFMCVSDRGLVELPPATYRIKKYDS